jgi:hypothetical protein
MAQDGSGSSCCRGNYAVNWPTPEEQAKVRSAATEMTSTALMLKATVQGFLEENFILAREIHSLNGKNC